jgi:hypothetical protein
LNGQGSTPQAGFRRGIMTNFFKLDGGEGFVSSLLVAATLIMTSFLALAVVAA